VRSIKEGKVTLERRLEERNEQIRLLEEEGAAKEEKIRRWEREIQRLEAKSLKG
jgi:ribosome recycling factor